MARILIIDDDAAFCEALAGTVTGLGHEAVQAASAEEGIKWLTTRRCDAIFLDYRMPGMSGIDALPLLMESVSQPPPVVMLTAYADVDNTIKAMKLGAFDHLTKPLGREDVRQVLARALPLEPARTSASASAIAEAGELIGVSGPMREVHKFVGLAAASDATVLVLGETGTGKEMLARALHRYSARAQHPFVAVNCAAIPKDLLESELFGHVRGAFTGASADRAGCFRSASGGVLLLDEIGDMAPAVQAKILRALQEGEVTPLGGTRPIAVDVRIVAATHRDLTEAVKDGSFREDLLYRLNVLCIRIPPLRERLADIIPLAEHFLALAARDEHGKALSAEAAQSLLPYPWPGNVRELKNLMDRCHALIRRPVIGAADLSTVWEAAASRDSRSSLPPDWLESDLPSATERLERILILRALELCSGNRAEAARRLGIHRQLLYQKVKALGLD
jgi:DNA-binding NtrC family response regulator